MRPRHELPGVGRNLQDHPFVTVLWEVSDRNTLYGADKPKALAEWLLRRSGKLSSTVAEVVAFTRTRGGLPAADIQFHMGAAYYEDHGAETYDGDCMVIAPTLVSPKARGQVWLRSADPAEKPRIITNTLSEPDDVRSLIAGVRLARRIAEQTPLEEVIVKELKPGTGRRRGRRARSGSAQAPDAHLPPHRDGPHERHPPAGGGRLAAARARPARPAGDRRVDHADDHGRQHQRPDDHDRRARRRPDSSEPTRVSLSINYHREGDGPPLVLLHGVGHHWQAWQPVIERLVDSFDVIACDSPGFGRSAPLPSGIEPTIPAYADAFEWFFAELGLERPHVAGNSMGGAIALELARGRAASSVTAFSPAGFWTAAERRFCQLSLGRSAASPAGYARCSRRSRARAPAAWRCSGRPSAIPRACPPRRRWRRSATRGPRRRWLVRSPRSTATASPRREQLRSTPVTIAWGRRDRLLPYRLQAPRAQAMLPWATHVTLGAGHVPFYDDPAAVAEVIRACAATDVAADARAAPSAGR